MKEKNLFNCRSRKRVGGMWSGMSSNIQEFIRIFFKIAVILQVIAVQEKEMVVCGLQLP